MVRSSVVSPSFRWSWRPLRRASIALLTLLAVSCASAEVITPSGVLGTSEFGAVDIFGDGNFSDVFVSDLIDGGGLVDFEGTPDNILDDLHDNDFSSTNGWHAGDFDAGLPGGLDGDGDPLTAPVVDQQALLFELPGLFEVDAAHIWQQNQGPLFGEPPAISRGVEQFRILSSAQPTGDDFQLIGDFQLEQELGTEEAPAQVISFAQPFLAQRIRFEIQTAYSGLDNEFVGLSEVRFEGTSVAATPGDFDGDGNLAANDIDELSFAIRMADGSAIFDLNADGQVTVADRDTWVRDLKGTWFGDSNLDGFFDTGDFVFAFTAGQYEDGIAQNSTWATGDWSGDFEFDSTDFVAAFTDGGFEQGARAAVAAVPEPTTGWLALLAAGMLLPLRRPVSSKR